MAWADKPQARIHWPDAIAIADATLDNILQAAYIECYNYAPKISDRTFTDGVTTSGSAVIASATALFDDLDVGRSVSGTGIPVGATIIGVISSTQAVLSASATATGTLVSITVSGTPINYTLGNIFQAREIFAAAQRGEQDVIGVGDYAIRARPLTAAVKQLLRPQHGKPVIG